MSILDGFNLQGGGGTDYTDCPFIANLKVSMVIIIPPLPNMTAPYAFSTPNYEFVIPFICSLGLDWSICLDILLRKIRKDIYVDLEGYANRDTSAHSGTISYCNHNNNRKTVQIRRIVNTSTKVVQDKEERSLLDVSMIDPEMMSSCFAEKVELCDMCSSSTRGNQDLIKQTTYEMYRILDSAPPRLQSGICRVRRW